MSDRDSACGLLRQALGIADAQFRPGQWEAIDALVNRRERLLVVQRTGWGKSSVYFIATRILRDRGSGPTLIVSPLLALMRNQIEAANRLRIKALTVNSTNREEWPALTQAILNNEADALLISPERLANDDFVQNVLLPVAGRIGLLVVDEAHCISDWGHDFRPDYRRLVNVLQHMPPNMPVLGTTATANNRVLDDVCSQLGGIQVRRGPLMRESLILQTLRLPDQSVRLAWLAEHLPELPGTGIVYTLTRRDADQVAGWLGRNGIEAKAYYSDVESPEFADSSAYRQHLEDLLRDNRLKALVATTALGMGYDKPDLGFVVHYQAPGSIITYYQQVGRAGRAIDHAFGVLLSGREDEEIHEFFRSSAFPDEGHVKAILELLAAGDGLTERQMERSVNLRMGQIEQVLKFLSVENPSPVIKDGSLWKRTPVDYRMDGEHIRRLTLQRVIEWQEVQDYIDSRECLMVFLARVLDDENPRPCGKCAVCLGHPVVAETYSRARAVEAARFLRQSELPLECRRQVAKDAFQQYGFSGNIPRELRAETGRVLSRWGDAGWGQLVAEDKHAGRFRDELARALAEMIRNRWKPDPMPTWVTCVPSLSRPHLVPDLAKRLAALLELPFVPVVTKVGANEPQKLQQNRFRQCSNLDGVFKVTSDVQPGPVLLMDDLVDSAWTMTVVAALLRQAGAGPVLPVALATTSARD
ncbi:RecQ family ATP-dependent DNA helicase [candidate division WOR-3 bacterium]|uniref:DNA 3'-5' helicase n=1 Tax=candidate division WOR-3 bacterium TaxID=2052148 RepID=A0A938BUK0_UNCW3|nr:RecQ family ATP-dependent DNA helicase [candidate division WOR-3 bacterium]